MEIKITHRKENQLLSRTEINGTINFTGATPNFDALKKDLAEVLRASEETIVVKEIYTKFGFPKADFRAFAYQTKEKLEFIEPKKKEKKKEQQAAKK